MISLHDLHARGGDVEKVVLEFGRLHLLSDQSIAGGSAPNWEMAERHWVRIVHMILGGAAPPPGSSPRRTLRRAENAAVGFLLALDFTAGHRCPICRLLNDPDPA